MLNFQRYLYSSCPSHTKHIVPNLSPQTFSKHNLSSQNISPIKRIKPKTYQNNYKSICYLLNRYVVKGTLFEACTHSLQVFSVLWPSFALILVSRNAYSQAILHKQVSLHLGEQGPDNWEFWVYRIFSWKFTDFQTFFRTFQWFEILDHEFFW